MTEQLAYQPSANHDDLLWQQIKTLPAFRALLRAVEARFYQQLDLPEPVLDIGCGDGHFAQTTFDRRLQVGIDPWWGPLSKAAVSNIYDLPLQAMGDHMPFPDHLFASAFSNSVLEHIPDIQPVLNEIGRVLQLGAPFVITVPSHYFSEYLGGAQFFEQIGLEGMADRYRALFNRISRHAHTDPPQIWCERLGQAGFEIERWQYYFSREALQTLEIGHVQGVPSAIMHALTGHWIIGPYKSNLKWTERWVRPYFEEDFPEKGAYLFFLARKASDSPLSPKLPAPRPYSLAQLAAHRLHSHPEETLTEATPPATSNRYEKIGVSHAAAIATPMASPAGEDSSAERASQSPGSQQKSRRRWFYLLGLVLALLAPRITGLGSSLGTLIGFATWLAAIATAIFALSKPDKSQSVGLFMVSRFTGFATILLFLAALFLRLYDVAQHPFILNGTEASIGMDVLNVINGEFNDPFSTGWLTNPSLPLFFLAIPIQLLGPSVLALRLLSPFVGAITIVVTFLFGQRLYSRVVGLVAAVLLTGSYFHLHYSRLGLTNVWDALLVLLSLGWIAIAWQQDSLNNRKTWLLAGLSVGFSAYLYTSSHLLPLMLLFLLAVTLLLDHQTWQRQWRNVFAMAAVALVVALPQILFYWANPGIFMDRANTLGILDSQSGWLSREVAQTGAGQLQILGRQLWAAALAFNATLDTGTSFGPLKPLLNFISGILAAIGFLIAIFRMRRIQYSMLIVWVVTTIIFAGALLLNPPNSQRYIIAAPAVIFLVAVSLVELIKTIFNGSAEDEQERATREPWYQQKPILMAILLAIATAVALYDVSYYFGSYREEHHFADRNTEVADLMSEYLNTLEGEWSVYFYGPPSMYVDFPTIPFLAGSYQKDKNLFDITDPEAALPQTDSANHVFIYLPERYSEIANTKVDFPDGIEKTFAGYYSAPLFHVYEVRD